MRRLPQANYQLFVGVVIGLICSFCLNEIFRSSITTWRTTDIPVSRKLAKYNFEKTVPPTIQSKNQSFNDVRVLCWVLTCPQNHRTRAIHVKRTWGKRCDKLLFISTEEDSAIDVIAVPGMPSGRDGLWGKTKAALKYAWEHHKDEFDWFMKADDDTYVIVENLKKFLSNYSRTDPVFFGCQFSAKEIPAWTSGGAGYVLSAEALRRFALDGLPNPENCKVDNDGSEDAELAKCLLRVGVTLEDSRDSFGRHRFLAFTPADHLFPRTLTEADKKYWYWQDLTYPQVQGMDCCASDAISYHYITSREMYVLEYFLYHIRPAGVDQEEKYVQEYPLEFVELTTATPTSTKPTSSKPISTKSTATKPTSTKTTSAKPNPTKHKPSSTVGINQSKSSKSTESAIIV